MKVVASIRRAGLFALALLLACSDVDHDAYTSGSGDCDDHDPLVYPFAPERCNQLDDDCNGAIDDDPTDGDNYWRDDDGDGLGDPEVEVEACDEPDGYVDNEDDCDDTTTDDDCVFGSDRLSDLSVDQLTTLCEEFAEQSEWYHCDRYDNDYEFPGSDCADQQLNDCDATVDQVRACVAAWVLMIGEDACALFDGDVPAECDLLVGC